MPHRTRVATQKIFVHGSERYQVRCGGNELDSTQPCRRIWCQYSKSGIRCDNSPSIVETSSETLPTVSPLEQPLLP